MKNDLQMSAVIIKYDLYTAIYTGIIWTIWTIWTIFICWNIRKRYNQDQEYQKIQNIWVPSNQVFSLSVFICPFICSSQKSNKNYWYKLVLCHITYALSIWVLIKPNYLFYTTSIIDSNDKKSINRQKMLFGWLWVINSGWHHHLGYVILQFVTGQSKLVLSHWTLLKNR